ncbi:cadherin-23 [Magallana gigas]|uniref:cadherin-23 n=1 Tax=Magallana gigas TaxID=29159 RepID=UPI00333FD508
MISGIQTCCLLMLICNSLSSLTLPNIKPDKNITEIDEGNSTMKIFTISASEENGGTVQIVAACQTNDIVNLNSTMIGSNTTVDVYLKEPLDRETQSNYTLRFRAISNFTSLRSSEVEVSLIVLDINDTPPKFSQLTYILELEEDTPFSSILNASICADDPDSGQGGLVNYSLQAAGQDSRFYNNTFEIDQRNGSIQLLQPLDYEKRTFYQYRIIATDGGDPKLNSTADLLIMVKDVQDTPPIFQRLPFMTTISETTPIWTSIYKIFATDGDTGIPDNITYSLTYQSNETACDNFLRINSITGVISIKQLMDRDGGTIKRLNGICIVNVTASEITNATANKNSQTTKPFTITVQDENDNRPKFSKKQYEGSVKENMRDITISIPGNIQVFDIDQNGYNNIKLTVLNRTDVVPSPDSVIYNGTVLLRLTSPLDYENEKNITFLIKAEDTNNPSFVSNSTVIVKINDTNDNDPVFQSRDNDLFLPENSCFNTTVGKIKATDIDSGNYGKIEYRLDRNSSFKIEATTGRVYVSCKNSCARGCNNSLCDNSCLDREKKDRYYLTVSAIDGGGRRTSLPITIYLNDTNDNRPKFRYNSYQIGLLENRKTFSDGKEDLEIQADDVDLSENKTISYKLLQNSPHFHINESTGKITITKEVDYENLTEANGYINLTIIASDHGKPQQSSSVQLTIQVKDLNDNRPEFRGKTYNASVCENAASGTNVTVVSATDADKTALNNKYSYFIEKGGSDQFTLNGKTGEISVQVGANLDREIKSKYTLTVIAIDKGDPQNTGTTTVFISLTDENDTPPRWLNLPNTTTVKENTTEPAIFKCIGDDSDINHTLVYSIRIKEALDSNGNLVNLSLIEGKISINSTTGVVSVNNLDAEVAVTIRLTVTVNDTSTTKNDPNATSELIIKITDENDNPPVFQNALYTSVILENAPNNTFLVSVTATDIDISKKYTTIRYYIDDKQCPFSINPRTGGVIKTRKLDWETKPFWIITIRASDDSKYNATAELNVTVLDFNDNTPFFLNESYLFSVTEQNYSQTQIGQLYAKDLDAGPNQKITYKITRGNAESYFHISDVNGSLFINGNIDRETMPKYELVVTINDNPIEKADTKLNSAHVIVNILDVNDNAPVFTSNSKQQIRVKETTNLGTVVGTVSATDKDFGNNGTVYYIIGSNGNVSNGLFVIDNDTGVIHVDGSIKNKVGIYTLEVLAIDKGSPPMISSVLLDIFILDENIHRPEFTVLPKNGIISINKCVKKGTTLTKIQATDKDKDFNNQLVNYEFFYSNASTGQRFELFHIDNITGEIKLIRDLSYGIKQFFKIYVICTDSGFPPLSSITPELTIQITDVIDNPPEFLTNITKVGVKENQNGTILLTTVSAVEKDSTAVIEFKIKDGNYSSFFGINSSSGEISTTKPLDREIMNEITLVVEATDVSKPEIISDQCNNTHVQNNANSLMKVIVTVQDLNDNPPIFRDTEISKFIMHNTVINTIVMDLSEIVVDKDSSIENRKHNFYATNISYTGALKNELKDKIIKANCGQLFCVHPNGTVVTNFVFSKKMKGQAKLQVAANDSAGNTTALLKFYIYDYLHVVAMHIIKKASEVDGIKLEILSIFSNITGYDCIFHKMDIYKGINGESDPFTTLVKFYVVDRKTDEVLEASDVVTQFDDVNNDSLARVRNRYSIRSLSDLQYQNESIDKPSTDKMVYILIAVIALMIVFLGIFTFLYIRNTLRYKMEVNPESTVDREEDKNKSSCPGKVVDEHRRGRNRSDYRFETCLVKMVNSGQTGSLQERKMVENL